MSFFAASSLTAVLHSLNEVMENIEVYHEFWFEEATNLATKLDIQMKLPGKFRRAQHSNLESQLTSESYYKETLKCSNCGTHYSGTERYILRTAPQSALMLIPGTLCHGTAQIQYIRGAPC